jgi:flavin reductase (DIM6/NTAB) family NADH-FMN oxidoreductase RutF
MSGGSHIHLDFAALTERQRYKLLIGSVIPRPIAFVTTIDREGTVNAAPFSFFNCLSADPPIVALGIEYRAGLDSKDTGRNIRETEEFTVNIVSDAIVEAMNVGAVPFGPDVDEIERAGLTSAPGVAVACPRIAESPAAFECRRYVTLEIGRSREIVLGTVLGMHIREDALDRSNFHVDPAVIDAIGRMGGHGYARTRDRFDLPTMTVADWEGRRMPVRMNGARSEGSAAPPSETGRN